MRLSARFEAQRMMHTDTGYTMMHTDIMTQIHYDEASHSHICMMMMGGATVTAPANHRPKLLQDDGVLPQWAGCALIAPSPARALAPFETPKFNK